MEGRNEIQKKIEIRTMAKDIAHLREKETDKQRDKIVAIKAGGPTRQINDARNFNVGPKLPQLSFQGQKQKSKEEEASRQKIEKIDVAQKRALFSAASCASRSAHRFMSHNSANFRWFDLP